MPTSNNQIQPIGDDGTPANPNSCRRIHERTPLSLHGSYQMLASEAESAIRVTDVSPGGARVLAADIPALDSEIVMKISGLGSLGGRVVRADAGGFAVQFTNCSAERQRMAASIAWNFNKTRLGLADRRSTGSEAIDHCDPIEFSDGAKVDAAITELTLSGAVFRCTRPVTEDERVRIGTLTGRVANVRVGGFAVTFDPPSA